MVLMELHHKYLFEYKPDIAEADNRRAVIIKQVNLAVQMLE